jgi:hypothetical protein
MAMRDAESDLAAEPPSRFNDDDVHGGKNAH